MSVIEMNERNKRSVHHIANTEQRIIFKEVTLQPKSPEVNQAASTGEGADKGAPETDTQKIDRMTGRTTVTTRAPRAKGSGKKKGKAPASEASQEVSMALDDRMDVTQE